MTQVKLKDGLKFISKDESNRFEIHKWHYYDNEEIWCAYMGGLIYPLSELDLSEYFPIINGIIINEKYEIIE